MKINELKYERTFNLGQYESEKIGVGVAVDADKENPSEVLAQMISFVNTKGLTPITSKNEPVVEKAEPKKAAPPEKKPEPAKEEVALVAEAPKAVVEAPKATAPEKKPRLDKTKSTMPKETKVKVSAAITPYDRTNDLHKKLVTELLDDASPSWKTKAVLAKETSAKMQGKPFLNSEGHIILDFRQEFKAHMGIVD